MKTFKLPNGDVYDLASVMASVVRENSDKLAFREVINLQKTVNTLVSSIQDFSDRFDKIGKEKQSLVDVSNKKIAEFKDRLQNKTSKDGEIDKEYKEKLDSFVQMVLDEANTHIAKEIGPQYEELYGDFGKQEVECELDDDKMALLVANFEKYAKDKYINKNKMVAVYEVLTG